MIYEFKASFGNFFVAILMITGIMTYIYLAKTGLNKATIMESKKTATIMISLLLKFLRMISGISSETLFLGLQT